jgi:hypothetical protein
VNGGTPAALASNQSVPRAIVVDGSNLYWVNASTGTATGTVMKMPLSGGMPTTLASGQYLPDYTTVDATSVYWVSCEANSPTCSLMKTPK